MITIFFVCMKIIYLSLMHTLTDWRIKKEYNSFVFYNDEIK